ncbi:MAG: ABC transporter ATP-binding protein [Xanthobacteraceae bacterium]|nr:ABC transporter ATP-binding protein [Xanthobacteraceae bacterium]MBX3549028.1 ABC transporter ATP-binding protein [Xanthobacteraceae bacterium]MCW5675419.1 ABC transporter ATP-binding protein [Xanthobacteraceae bacterium]MCW5676569.1 ABC transporter ATP-binding protein [Xanthobacteraceae bacterium]
MQELHAGYGAVQVLHGISIEVRDGETLALLGTNGNGKSTLMKCLIGDVRPNLGQITLEIDGVRLDLAQLSTNQIVDFGISIVPEGRRLFPQLTVEENLQLGAYRKAARAKISENLDYCYDAFSILKEKRHQPAGSMSGGQQQMLAIARALMSSPRILLVDEPSVGLAPIMVSQAIAKIGELKERFGLTVVMAEQNFQEAMRIADRGYVLVHGEIALAAETAAELKNSDLIQQLYLGT